MAVCSPEVKMGFLQDMLLVGRQQKTTDTNLHCRLACPSCATRRNLEHKIRHVVPLGCGQTRDYRNYVPVCCPSLPQYYWQCLALPRPSYSREAKYQRELLLRDCLFRDKGQC